MDNVGVGKRKIMLNFYLKIVKFSENFTHTHTPVNLLTSIHIVSVATNFDIA